MTQTAQVYSPDGSSSLTTASITAAGAASVVQTSASVATAHVSNAGAVCVVITGTWVGTLQFEGTVQDDTGYFALNMTPNATGSVASSTTATGQWFCNVGGLKKFRVRCSAYTSGTAIVNIGTSTAEVSGASSVTSSAVLGSVVASGNVASGATDSGNPVKVGGVYNSTPPTLTNGQRGDLQLDTRANEMVNLSTRLDPTNDQVGAMPVSFNVASAITTSGAGYILGDCIGGIISLTTVNYASGRPVKLKSVCIKDKGGAAPAMHIEFYKSTPTGGTYTDNSAVVRGTTDSANRVGTVNVLAADYLTDITETTATFSGIDHQMSVNATTLFVLLIAQASFTETNGNLTVEWGFEQL